MEISIVFYLNHNNVVNKSSIFFALNHPVLVLKIFSLRRF